MNVKVCLFVCLFTVAGADDGGQCCSGSEAAGPPAPRGRSRTPRNSRMAQHAQLDLQTSAPLVPAESLQPPESTQTGASFDTLITNA